MFRRFQNVQLASCITLSLAGLLIGLSLFSPLIVHATTYLPGATLEPDCAPGSANCGVSPIGDAHTGSGVPTTTTLATGALYFDTVGGIFYAYNGTAWVSVGSGTTISSLNGQSAASQTFAIGTAGTDAAWSSAAGVHTLNIPDASALNRGLITTGTQTIAGTKTFSGSLIALDGFATPHGTDYAVTGTSNNIDLGPGSLYRYTGIADATFTGIAGGTDGRMIAIMNTTEYTISLTNQDTSSSVGNRIVTPTDQTTFIAKHAMATLQYDGTASLWRIISLPLSSLSVTQGGNGFGTTAIFGTTDANALNLITSGTTRFTLATGASTLTGTGPTTLTSTSTLALSSAAASTIGITTGTTGALTLDSGTTGAVNLANGAASKIITVGNTTGTTALNLNSGSGGILLTGNTTIAGSKTFSTGTGTTTINSTLVTLAGAGTTIDLASGTLNLNTVGNAPITTGSGLFTLGGGLAMNGSLSVAGNIVQPKGTDYNTTGAQNNVNLGTGSYIRYTGAGAATFTGIAGGENGRIITITNASSTSANLTIKNNSGLSTDINRIVLETSGDVDIQVNSSLLLQYDSGISRWRVIVLPLTAAGAVDNFVNNGVSFGTTAVLGTNDFYGLNFITNGVNALTLDTAGNANLTGDLTVTGGDVITPSATALNITTGTTGILTLDSGTTGAINIGTSSVAKAITIGNTTGATAVNINTGSGGLNVNGNTTFTGGNSFTSGSGAFQIVGNYATPKGTDYTTSGVQNNVNVGTGSLIRYTGAGSATFTGLTGGTDGRQIRLVNASAYIISFTNEDSGSLAANRILTTAIEGTLTVPVGSSVTFQYDSSSARWRLTDLPASSGSISHFAVIQGGNAFGVAANIGTTDAFALNLKTNNVTAIAIDTSSNVNFTGDITVTGSDVVSPASTALNITTGTTGVLTLDSGSTGAVNLGTGAAAKVVTIGNTTTTSALNLQSGSGNINLQVAGTSTIGNVQIGAGTGSATPDLFVLDLKNNSSADPAGGTSGASYYNTTSNKFRCYEAGGWKDCDTTGGTTTLQTAYAAGPGVTTTGADFALTLTSGNFTATGAGAVNLSPTTSSSFTSGGALTFTAGATSIWGTTAGDLKLQIAGTSTTGNVQIGAGSTGSATPDLLVLDTKSVASGSSDPTGTKGAMYYNIALEKMRCYEGTAWKDCDTTVGTGLGSLNGQTGSSQTLVTGTSGSDFNISSALNVHTFNIPDAALTARGLVTTGTQSFEGAKTFNHNLLVNGNATLGNAAGDALTINGATLTLAGNSSVLDMTGTGILSLNTVTNRAITTGTGLFTMSGSAAVSGNLTVTGNYSSPKGTDFSTTGSQNNVDFGAGSYFRFTGASQATITGIANPTDGRRITVTNASSVNLVFSNQDASSTDVNRIITTTSANLTVDPDASISLQYDVGVSRWRLVALPASRSTIAGFGFLQGGNAFTATASLGTTDAFALNLKTNNVTALALDTSGNGNLTGDLTVTGGDISSPAATSLNMTAGTTGVLTLDTGSTGAINIGTNSNAKTITIGNTSGATAVNLNSGSGNILFTSTTATFQTATATNDELAIIPHAGDANSFTGNITSADITAADKTWTLPNLTGNILLDTSTCPSTGSFACGAGNNTGSTLTLGTTDANPMILETSGTTRFTVATGAATLTGNGTTSIISTGTLALSSAAASAVTMTTGTTGALTLDSGTTGAVNLGNGASSKIVTIGNTTGTTALNLNSGSGGIALAGNTSISGTNTFATGSGTTTINSTAITLAGASTVMDLASGTLGLNTTSNQPINIGTGLVSVGGAMTVTGTFSAADGFATPKGADYATTGTVNDVNFGNGSLFRYTGLADVTITGIAGGTDGRQIRVMNASSSNFIVANENLGSTAANRLLTTSAANVTIPALSTVMFQYDSAAARWRVVSIPVSASAISGYAFLQSGNAYGATAVLGTTDANALNLITSGATRFTIATSSPTLTGTGSTIITSTGTTTLNSAATSTLTVDSGTTGSLLLGTGVAAKTITIGNGTDDTLTINSSGLVVSSGGALTGVASIDTIATSSTALTFAGAGTISSATTSAITLDSGSTGAVNVGTGANAKTVTIGNITSTSALNLQSGTGNILMTVDGSASSGMVRIGNSATATPDLLVLDNGTADPTGVNGGMYYSTGTNKLRCYENGAWKDCIPAGSGAGTDLQHAASYDTAETVTNIPTGGAQVVLGTVSVTPSSVTGDVYVSGWADVFSGDAADQPFQLVVETTSNCTGSTVGNASVTYTISSNASTANVRGVIRVAGLAVDPGASAHPYSLCAAVTSGAGNSNVEGWGIEALVIDTGADLAENYTSNDSSLEAGDVVSLDANLQTGVRKSSGLTDPGVIGIVSTRPGQLIGGVDREGVQVLPVALVGRVPVKVSAENGPVTVGDYLVPSSIPGVAMKANATGTVIGQAMSNFTGNGQGIVLAFVKNFAQTGGSVLLGSISPDAAGLVDFITTIQSEAAHDPIAILTTKIGSGTEFLTDFVAARVTAIRGYFDELFTRKIHTDQLCVKKSDGTEICVTGDQLQNAVGGTVQNMPVSIPTPVVTPAIEPPPAASGGDTTLRPDEPVTESAPEPVAESISAVESAPTSEVSAATDAAPIVEAAPAVESAPAPAADNSESVSAEGV